MIGFLPTNFLAKKIINKTEVTHKEHYFVLECGGSYYFQHEKYDRGAGRYRRIEIPKDIADVLIDYFKRDK